MLEGWRFTLYTDHKPLTHALAKVVEPWTARQSRHLSYLAEFTSDISLSQQPKFLATATCNRQRVPSGTGFGCSRAVVTPNSHSLTQRPPAFAR